MIRLLDKRPEILGDPPEDSRPRLYIEGYSEPAPGHDGRPAPYGYLEIVLFHEMAVLHLEIVHFSHRVLRSLQADWEEIKAMLKPRGITILSAVNSNIEDDRWPKFLRYWGFNEPEITWTAHRRL